MHFILRLGRPHFDLRRQILSKLIAVEVNKTYAFTSYLVAYPKPAIQWILPSSVHFRNRLTDGFEHESTVFITSAVESPAGEYTMFANNSKGNMLFSFTVVVEGVPTAPYHVFVTCKETIAFVTWQSEFNGGQDQTFNVQYWNLNQPDLVLISDTVNDPGLSNISLLEIKELISASHYSFAVVALNKYGDATSRVLDCKTDDGNRNHNESNHYDSIITQIGIPVLSAFVSAILVIIVIYISKSPAMNEAEISNPSEYIEMNNLPAGSSKSTKNGILIQRSGSSNNNSNNEISSYDYTIMPSPLRQSTICLPIWINQL
ncbi:unnamed protein product [Mytilus coruscus]|uniref:Fibronectin type-III domain-containing protein n=1 Tax=Mytilus coruscus TaxID=42192 RepID=A0A6J8CQ37_MYTCO|nr:unnamed protein product [Mytilus coruscus]